MGLEIQLNLPKVTKKAKKPYRISVSWLFASLTDAALHFVRD